MYNYSFNLVVVYISFNWSIIDRFLFGSQHWLNIHAHIHLNDWLSSSSSSVVVVVVSRLTSTCQLCRYDSTFGQVWWYTRLSNERLLFRSSHWKKTLWIGIKGKTSLSHSLPLSHFLLSTKRTERPTYSTQQDQVFFYYVQNDLHKHYDQIISRISYHL